MSNVVKLLEMLSVDTREIDDALFAQVVRDASLGPEVETALLARDVVALAHLVQAPATVFCGLFPSENEEPADAPAEQPVEQPDSPNEEKASARAA